MTPSPLAAFALLALARLVSAAFNIIHDCDETYNYLEPLHYLLHGSGMQVGAGGVGQAAVGLGACCRCCAARPPAT